MHWALTRDLNRHVLAWPESSLEFFTNVMKKHKLFAQPELQLCVQSSSLPRKVHYSEPPSRTGGCRQCLLGSISMASAASAVSEIIPHTQLRYNCRMVRKRRNQGTRQEAGPLWGDGPYVRFLPRTMPGGWGKLLVCSERTMNFR